jgi:hypothetical protein
MASSGFSAPAVRHYIGMLRERAERSNGMFIEDAFGNIKKYSEGSRRALRRSLLRIRRILRFEGRNYLAKNTNFINRSH